MGEYDISQWRLAGTKIHTPSDPKMATGVRTGFTASNAGPQGRALWGLCWVPTPAPTAPGTHGLRNPGRPTQRTGGRGGTAPDTRRPSQRWRATPPGMAPHHPCGTQPPQGMQAERTVIGTHTHMPAPAARG